MALLVKKCNSNNGGDDEEDLESLRMAALMTLRKKPPPQPPQPVTVSFQPHYVNPNLIAIIPEGSERQNIRKNFYRQPPPRQPPFRPQISTIGSTIKVLPQVQLENVQRIEPQEKAAKIDKEEVSTKFSRFEDSESESEDESETEKKESESSDDSDDVLTLEDDDDSLEALMAQMEHEIEEGIDPEPSKKEKKKTKSKSKEKEGKVRGEEKNAPDKLKSETKTAVVEPTFKEVVKVEHRTQVNTSPSAVAEKAKSPVKILPLKPKVSVEQNSLIGNTPFRKTSSPDKQRSKSPQHHRSHTPPPKSPQRARSPTIRIVTKSRSPVRQRSRSPRRSPIRCRSLRRSFSPSRPKSPRKMSPGRRSPLRNSPDRFVSGNKSPYYKPRGRDYSARRSRSPLRRRSLSPKKDVSPKYYRRRSRSPKSPVYYSPVSPRYSPWSPSNLRRRSLSPRNRKSVYSAHSPRRGTPKRRSLSPSPRRSKSPRKREYSPRRRQASPRRDLNFRRNSLSPKQKLTPPHKRYSPSHSPKSNQRSPSPRRNISPRRRTSPAVIKDNRLKMERRSRTPSLSLSPSPPPTTREAKETIRRFKSPLRSRKESADNSNDRTSRQRRGRSPGNKLNSGEIRERRKPNKDWERDREGKQWDRKVEDRRKEKVQKTDKEARRERDNRVEKPKRDEPKEEDSGLKVTDNPVFEARRKKFESTAVIAPASKKIRLGNKRNSLVDEKSAVDKKKMDKVEDEKIVENMEETVEDFSGHEEIDEIDNFLNEDVLDLSAEVWSSDDDLFPKPKKNNKAKKSIKAKSPVKKSTRPAKEKITLKEKESHKPAVVVGTVLRAKVKSKPASPPLEKVASTVKQTQRSSSEAEQEEDRRERDDSDLRAELSRRREERLTKAGSLHEKLPARLLQSAFESALGTKRPKKEEKIKKSEKVPKNKELVSPPPRKEKSDGRRVLVLKRPAAVRMQSAHINVTFPKDNSSDTESSYSSSSSEDQYASSSAAKRKLPVYMRLGTTQMPAPSKHAGRKVKLQARRSQV